MDNFGDVSCSQKSGSGHTIYCRVLKKSSAMYKENKSPETFTTVMDISGLMKSKMYLVPQMATALVFFIYVSNEGMEQVDAQYYNTGLNLNKEVRICGPLLTNTLELVCQGRFNTVNKKDAGTRSQSWTNNDRENFAIFPFRSRRNALAFNAGNTFRRRTRNVADECCFLKACTLAEITHYCERN